MLIACGLPATLKTTVVTHIAGVMGCTLLRTDLIRRELLAEEDISDEARASDMGRRTAVYDEMFRRAAALPPDSCLVLDATFVTQELRERAAGIAAARETNFVIVETVCARETALERLQKRNRTTSDSNAVTVAAYEDNERRFEPVDLDRLAAACPGLPMVHLTVDTSEFAPASWRIIRREARHR